MPSSPATPPWASALLRVRDWSLLVKLFALGALATLPLLLLLIVFVLPAVEDTLYEQKRVEVAGLTEGAFDVIQAFGQAGRRR